jgi:hypothetical protein
MEVSCQLHAPAALPLGLEPSVPIGYEAGWTSEPARTLWGREKSFAPAGNRTPLIQSVAWSFYRLSYPGLGAFRKTRSLSLADPRRTLCDEEERQER